jgi:hypothetical protein
VDRYSFTYDSFIHYIPSIFIGAPAKAGFLLKSWIPGRSRLSGGLPGMTISSKFKSFARSSFIVIILTAYCSFLQAA